MDATVTKARRAETDALFKLDMAIGDEASGGDPRRELSTGPFVEAVVAAVESRVRAELAAAVKALRTAPYVGAGATFYAKRQAFDDVLALLEPKP